MVSNCSVATVLWPEQEEKLTQVLYLRTTAACAINDASFLVTTHTHMNRGGLFDNILTSMHASEAFSTTKQKSHAH